MLVYTCLLYTSDWVYHIFEDNYITAKTIFTVDECHFKQENGMVADAVIHHNGNDRRIVGVGNGRLDAVSNAIKHYFDVDYQLAFYEEHSLTKGSSSRAVAYVGIIYTVSYTHLVKCPCEFTLSRFAR